VGDQHSDSGGISRRGFISAVGVGAVAAGAGAGALLEPVVAAQQTPGTGGAVAGELSSNHFGRIFQLPSFAEPSDALTAALTDLGKPGGLMDAKDDLSKGPVALIGDQTLPTGNRDNPTQTTGTTFLGLAGK